MNSAHETKTDLPRILRTQYIHTHMMASDSTPTIPQMFVLGE